MKSLEEKAREMSRDFLENDKQYRLGFIEAEQSNPKTKNLGQTFVSDTESGVKMIFDVDRDLVPLFEQTVLSEKFDEFYSDLINTLKNRKRIFISGCGATGRLAIRLETSFREAVKKAANVNPDALLYKDSVHEIMTGGDYAIIRSVESFEDYIELGSAQVRDAGVKNGDVLIGVTATGETTSILGTAKQALANGARVWMVVCTNPESIIGKLERADAVYKHPACNSIYIKCGGMAVSGSTRMQSSSIEQTVISAALEFALCELLTGEKPSKEKKLSLVKGFYECVNLLSSKRSLAAIASQIEAEKKLYTDGNHVTYFSGEYLLDVLTDTTERSPTFTTPPFRPQRNKNETLSWAFVKNPSLNTVEAWESCFERTPRCISKTAEEYERLGVKAEDIKKIPRIDLEALYAFEIGNEPDREREGEYSLATWVGYGNEIPAEFYEQAKKYGSLSLLTIGSNDSITVKTRMNMFEHLAIKMMLNAVSTGTMAKMGRVRGNYMVHLNISNKKLVDRATRIIADLCKIDYDEANYELFYSKLLLDTRSSERSTTIETIDRLGQKN